VIVALRGRTDFQLLREQGVRVRSGALWCTVLVDPQMNVTAVGYAIGRKCGPAVVRNRLRRRLRACLGARGDRLPTGLVLVGVRPDAGTELAACRAPVFDTAVEQLVTKIEHTFVHGGRN
jgi:ribonuclease P protein component